MVFSLKTRRNVRLLHANDPFFKTPIEAIEHFIKKNIEYEKALHEEMIEIRRRRDELFEQHVKALKEYYKLTRGYCGIKYSYDNPGSIITANRVGELVDLIFEKESEIESIYIILAND